LSSRVAYLCTKSQILALKIRTLEKQTKNLLSREGKGKKETKQNKQKKKGIPKKILAQHSNFGKTNKKLPREGKGQNRQLSFTKQSIIQTLTKNHSKCKKKKPPKEQEKK
jgi:hypothetical protein